MQIYAIKLASGELDVRPGDIDGAPTPRLGEQTFAEAPLLLSKELGPGQFVNWATRRVNTDIDLAEEALLARVDGMRSERTRTVLRTVSPEVQYAWAEKAREATRYAGLSAAVRAALAPTTVARQYPWLSSEAASRGVTMATMADTVLNARNQWDAPLRAIDEAVMTIKAAIRAATTATTKKAAFDAGVWPE